MATKHRSKPDPTLTRMPPGIPYIVGNEAAERFSFYGMKAILTVFMTKYLMDSSGELDLMTNEEAKSVGHLFAAAAYFTPMIGALIADIFWGKYKTILLISLMYCVGHLCLAFMDLGPIIGAWDMRPFLFSGLFLIALGSGGIKPCVSAHVGDQFGKGNKHLLTQVFNWFYFSINLGAAVSQILTPILLDKVGPWLAFGLPGVLMGIATFVFWLGRSKFIHVPPAGWQKFKRETFSSEGLRALRNLAPLFLLFVPMFWALFDQTATAWVIQAGAMNRDFLGVTWLPSQIQFVNPVLILCGIPIFTYLVYPAIEKVFGIEFTPLKKIGVGLLITAGSFVISALIEHGIMAQAAQVGAAIWADLGRADAMPSLDAVLKAAREAGWEESRIQTYMGDMPSIGWQFVAYAIMTSAEIMVSIVCLEFAYKQAPPKMKSFIMGVYFLGVSFGNFFVSGVNFVLSTLEAEDGSTPLDGPAYYWFFASLMLLTAVVYVFWSRFYKGETYIQGEQEQEIIEAEAEVEGEG